MKKTKQSFIVLCLSGLLSIGFINIATAQEMSNPLLKEQVIPDVAGIKPVEKDDRPTLTPDIIKKLNEQLEEQFYGDFFHLISNYNARDKNYLDFLNSKIYEGHVPIYWLLSNYYAENALLSKSSAPVTVKNDLIVNINIGKENHENIQNAHEWLYIASIITQQDSYLCADTSARSITGIMNDFFKFPNIVVRDTPQFTEKAVSRAVFFLDNLKKRQRPEWMCISYGSQHRRLLNKGAMNKQTLVISESSWDKKRKEVLNSLTNMYRK